MKQIRKPGWYLVGGLVLGLALLTFSCGGTPVEEQSPAEQQQPATEQEQPTIEEPTTDEPATEETGATGTPPIPHDLAGRDDCLQCHGEAGLKPIPADHTGRINDICQGCHQPPN